jgi:hypothetical protein
MDWELAIKRLASEATESGLMQIVWRSALSMTRVALDNGAAEYLG